MAKRKSAVKEGLLFDDLDAPGFTGFAGEGGGLDALLSRLEEVSPNAHGDALYALLSGLPVEAEARRFAARVIAAAERAGAATEAGRAAAERAAGDRLDPGTEKVKAAALKVAREFDRLRGLLRFRAVPRTGTGEEAFYLALCAPDHFVLPLLAAHFERRFGEIPWAIVDEKRGLALVREPGKKPALCPAAGVTAAAAGGDGWEELWRQYHRVINNEARANPALQKQLMPARYWKYLTEMN